MFDRIALGVFLAGGGLLSMLGGVLQLLIRHALARYMAERSQGTLWGSKSVEQDVKMWEQRSLVMGTIFITLGLLLFIFGLVVLIRVLV
jgi:hypothetical protein